MSLIEKLKKVNQVEGTVILKKSLIYDKENFPPVVTRFPVLNLALSGSFTGGIVPGSHILAGPSKNFKSVFSLLLAKQYMDAYPDSTLLFYDTEYGTPKAYFDSIEIDVDRVLHHPVIDITELQQDLFGKLTVLDPNTERVIVIVDSIGNLASTKEIEDTIAKRSSVDMTRAKSLKAFFRVITPLLNRKGVPLIGISHVYKEQTSMYPKDVVGGGTGPYYSANTIWRIGRQQEKTGSDVSGYNFSIIIDKSRFLREQSKFDFELNYDQGLNRFSGLFPLAVECGLITNPSKGWYEFPDFPDLGKMRQKDIEHSGKIWKRIMETTDFASLVESKYQLGTKPIFLTEETDPTEEEEMSENE